MSLLVRTVEWKRYVDRANGDALTAIRYMKGLITYTHEEYLGLAKALVCLSAECRRPFPE